MAIGINGLAEYGPLLDRVNSPYWQDEFFYYTSGGMLTTLALSSGSTVWDNSTGGTSEVKLLTAASTNDYQGLTLTNAAHLFQAQQSNYVEGLFRYTNQATNNAAVVFGFWSATPVTSATGVPAVSQTGAIIYKLNGDTTWRVQSSNATTKTDVSATNVGCTNGTYHFSIAQVGSDASNALLTFRVNGVQLMNTTVGPPVPIYHKVAYASAAKMTAGLYVIAGSNNAQSGFVDYLAGGVSRIT